MGAVAARLRQRLVPAVVFIALSGLLSLASPRSASAAATCPTQGADHQIFANGLIVPDSCVLREVTIHNGVTVTGTGYLLLDGSVVTGGITVAPGGQIDIGGYPYFQGSNISGGITLDQPYTWDIYNSIVKGGFTARGDLAIGDYFQIPAICGTTISGPTTIRVPVQPNWMDLGDPGDTTNDGVACTGNQLHGRLEISHSTWYGVEVEDNTIYGNVLLNHSTVDLNANVIHGSALCVGTRNGLFPGFEYDQDPSSNTVTGPNMCVT